MSAVPFGTFRIIRLPGFIYLVWERNVEKNLSTAYTDCGKRGDPWYFTPTDEEVPVSLSLSRF